MKKEIFNIDNKITEVTLGSRTHQSTQKKKAHIMIEVPFEMAVLLEAKEHLGVNKISNVCISYEVEE